mmetsp:Transcript_6122/g.5523  ORF Transcript_6122/g.5523 Transcript_6122/m.5523 type:complete len:119 (-) Transcript_6122:921-1277(-)|eukprot:CAMPEP_0170564046 /NCGR_PEP_ID=MMETSP0211-20121228/70553_1 /TAXON_ID=311385 /ORGANISM="Pseudokeronopsis sp., Strain OXSARD2" /LENGTH=118 /DNA_ID=CAMNT_0010883017 /DNA_START=859 /DNA_END=1215 /DNA_ORIENTATION=-
MINLEEQKSFIQKNNGVSVISEAFDFGRRSWNIKIDIDSDQHLSLWLVERGANVYNQQKLEIGQTIPIDFSSVFVEFEAVDGALGERSVSIFYSFAHDTHQVIGVKNFLNISQLKDKS